MSAAILWSGGKDSIYALHKAKESGIDVKYAITGYFSDMIIPPTKEAIISQCKALNLKSIIIDCDLITFSKALELNLPNVSALIYGEGQSMTDIFWFKDFCKRNNKECILPALNISPHLVLNEIFSIGYKCMITRLSTMDMHYAGKDYDLNMYLRNKDIFKEPFGAASSLQTFVYDGPLFSNPIHCKLEKKQRGRVKMIYEE